MSVHRAVLLMMGGKATLLETDGRTLHSAHVELPLPVVISLTRYVHVPVRRPVPPTRRTVLQRDSHRCAYCGGGARHVDHVHPRSKGGRHEWTNVVAACVRCNHRKADRLLHDSGWELPFTPRAPRWSVGVRIGSSSCGSVVVRLCRRMTSRGETGVASRSCTDAKERA